MISYTLATVATAAALSIACAFNCTESGSFCDSMTGDVHFVLHAFNNETAELPGKTSVDTPFETPSAVAAAAHVLQASGSVALSTAFAVMTVTKLAGHVLGTLALIIASAVTIYAVVLVGPQAAMDAKIRFAVRGAMADLVGFYGSLFHYLCKRGRYPAPGYFEDRVQARVQIFSLAMAARMWAEPHYRSGTFQNDMAKNLRNVAIPGTGVPLSIFCYWKPVAYAFLLAGYPLAALVSAINMHRADTERVCAAFREQLVTPQEWFSFWRLNCLLSTFHASVTGDKGYDMEDKHAFLTTAERKGISVSPSLKMPKLIVKHRNEEGGLGLHSFTNAFVDSGEWLIQEHLENDEFVSALLPSDAPLSTFRVVSQSRAGLPEQYRSSASGTDNNKDHVTALSCVFRAGREGAVTDHVSVLYDVDMTTGVIGLGNTNQHWYQLGLDKVLTTPWNNTETTTVHPDTGGKVTGTLLGHRLPEMLDLVETAHAKMCPNVPLVGWDVAFTNKGMLLLEGNFSCNFFRGSFDKNKYFAFVNDYFLYLDDKKYSGRN